MVQLPLPCHVSDVLQATSRCVLHRLCAFTSRVVHPNNECSCLGTCSGIHTFGSSSQKNVEEAGFRLYEKF